jgi:hypothetical protein
VRCFRLRGLDWGVLSDEPFLLAFSFCGSDFLIISSSGEVVIGVCLDAPAFPCSRISSWGSSESTWKSGGSSTWFDVPTDSSLIGTEGGADGKSRKREGIAGAGAKSGCRLLWSIVSESRQF